MKPGEGDLGGKDLLARRMRQPRRQGEAMPGLQGGDPVGIQPAVLPGEPWQVRYPARPRTRPNPARAERRESALPGLERAAAEALVAEAHQVCPYSNATRGNIDVRLVVL